MLSLTPRRPRPAPSLASREQSLAAMPPTAGQAAAAHTNLGLLSSAFRATERAQYGQEGILTEGLSRYYQGAGWLSPDLPVESPIREPAELNKLYPPPKGEEPFFSEAIPDSLARVIHRQRLSEIASERTIARYNNARGFIPGLGVGFVGFLNDPLQAATSFVPGAGQAKFAQLLGKLGIGARTARVGGEVGAGAVAGGAAEAVLALAQQGISSHDVDALTTREVVERIFYGAAGNALFQGIAPAIGEAIDARAARGRSTPARVEPARPVAPEAVARPTEAVPPEVPPDVLEASRRVLEGRAQTPEVTVQQMSPTEARTLFKVADTATTSELLAAAQTQDSTVASISEFDGEVIVRRNMPRTEAPAVEVPAGGAALAEPAAGVTSAPTVWDMTSLRERFTDAEGKLAMKDLDAIKDEAADALANGGRVTMIVEGKAREILSVSRLGLVDKDGNPWGVAPFLMQNPKLSRDQWDRIIIDPAPKAASVPFMITQAQKAELRTRGLTEQQIKDLTPQQAQDILRAPPRQSAAQTQRATVSAVASVLADEPVSVAGPRPTTPQSTLDAIEELNASRLERPDPNSEAVAGITKAAQAEAATRPAPERGEARSEARVAPVKETIQKQLTEIGVDSQQAEAAATLFDAFFRTMAARTGKTVQELYDESGLTFEKVTTAEGDFFQPAWHSSPHVFEQFSTDFMGAGEGAQMFGWGLYMSQVKGLYDHLRKRAPSSFTIAGADLTSLSAPALARLSMWIEVIKDSLPSYAADQFTLTRDQLLARANADIQRRELELTALAAEEAPPAWHADFKTTQTAALEAARESRVFVESLPKEFMAETKLGGRTFEVDVPDDDNLLLWDRPLSEQPQHVREAIEKLWEVIPGFDRGRLIGDDELTGQLVYEGAVQDLAALEYTGELGEVQRIWKELTGKTIDTDKEARRTVLMQNIIDAQTGIDNLLAQLRETSGDAYAQLRKQLDAAVSTRRLLVDELDKFNEADTVVFRPDEFVSRFLLREGIEGHKYLDRGSRAAGEGTYNFVIYSGDKVRIRSFYQDARGAIKFGEGKALISLFENSDPSTIIHEAGHFILETFIRLAKTEPKLAPDLAILQRQFDFTDTPSAKSHEDFASSWETYLRTGKAPSEELKSVFKLFKEWITEVYQRIKGKLPAINPEIRKLFDRMLAEPRSFGTPFEKPAPAKPPARLSDYTFRTSKGTEYEVRGSRTFRPDPRGDQLSDQTIYISPEDAKILRPLKLAKGTVSKLEQRPDGKWGLKWIQGEKAGTWDEAIALSAKDEPAEGLVPVGLTKDGTYANIGTQIVEINKPLKADPEMEALQRAVEELNLPPEELQAIMRDLEDYGTAQRSIPAAMTQAQQCLIEGGMF